MPNTPAEDRRAEVDRTVRPWGHFDQFTANEAATVKTITVQPGHRLSLQRHLRRAELWQILDAPMDVVVGPQAWRAEAGEVIWVPLGTLHRIGNPGRAPARVLEIAFGDFAEDDVQRLQDDYLRE